MSSAALSTLTLPAGEVTYDSNIKMGALRRIVKAAQSGDLDAMIDGFSRLVTAWPYEGDPADPASWDDLGRNEFSELVTAVTAAFGSAGEA